jgi:NitT/TauT family transport system substrate-binding protein
MNRAQFGTLTVGALATRGRPASAQGTAAFRFGVGGVESFALPVYASEAGFFAKQGLDPQLVVFSGGGAGMDALAAGAVDYVSGSWVASANAHFGGLPVVAFAGGGCYDSSAPTLMLAVAKDNTSVRTGKDLNGKTISVATIRDIQQAAIMKWVDATGGDSSTVRFIEMPPTVMLGALNSGHIDAASLTEPFVSSAKGSVQFVCKPYDTIAKKFMITAHFAKRDYLDANVVQSRKVAAALAATATWANTNQDKAGDILARLTKLAPATIASMARTVYATNLDAGLIQPVISASQQRGYINPSMRTSDMLWTPPKGATG